MRAIVQRVSRASVTVSGEVVGQIGRGLLVLLGVGHDDSPKQAQQLAEKITRLRIFDDPDGKMNLGLDQIDGEMLVVSQFTLLADCRKGRRPSFVAAAEPQKAEHLYEAFCDMVRGLDASVAMGRFRACMEVELVNDGPVTIWLDTNDL